TLLRVRGVVPAELWNRFGSKMIPKLRSAEQLQARVELTVEVETSALASLEMEIQQVLSDPISGVRLLWRRRSCNRGRIGGSRLSKKTRRSGGLAWLARRRTNELQWKVEPCHGCGHRSGRR